MVDGGPGGGDSAPARTDECDDTTQTYEYEEDTMPVEDLRKSPTMNHLLEAQEQGQDIGHYGRLVFAMVGHHFLSNDELEQIMLKGGHTDKAKVDVLIQQVESRDYSPPRREKLLEYQSKQDFPIVPNPDDPDSGNLYRELNFPDDVFQHIEGYREKQVEASQS